MSKNAENYLGYFGFMAYQNKERRRKAAARARRRERLAAKRMPTLARPLGGTWSQI